WVAGRGSLAEAHLLGGRSLIPGAPTGLMPSGSSFRTLFSPNPGDPGKLVRSAAESAVIGVAGDGTPGRGHWFFTPAPLYLALTTADPGERGTPAWMGLGVAAPVDELTFVQLEYRPGDLAFELVLDYEGRTTVEGEFRAPALVLTPGIPDPYAGLRRHRGDLVARGAAPAPRRRDAPSWWTEPMFCGWGAQCALAREQRRPAAELATQESYGEFLAQLERHGVIPGTIAIDDKWQAAYGTNRPDTRKWPDLGSWIAERHE